MKYWIIIILCVFFLYGFVLTLKKVERYNFEKGYVEACKDFYKGQLKEEFDQN